MENAENIEIETLSAQEATEILRRSGMRMSPTTIRDGLKDNRFPFGTYIPTASGSCVCIIYKKLFYQWMEQVGVKKEETKTE